MTPFSGPEMAYPLRKGKLACLLSKEGGQERRSASVSRKSITNHDLSQFWGGDATKHFSAKRKGFSVKRGEAIQ